MTSEAAPFRSITYIGQLDAFLRAIAAAAIAGAIAGIVAGGMGGRIAMRITALTAGDADQGAITEAEEVVGVISLDGTIGLIVFVGLFGGFFGGLLYAGARPWLADLGRWRGLAFGALLFAALGWMVIERDNFDFHRFGSATLNIAMFAALFLAFGLIVAPVFEFLVYRLPDVAMTASGVAGLAARALGLLALLASAGTGIGAVADVGGAWGLIPACLLLTSVVAAALLSSRTGGVRALSELTDAPAAPMAIFAVLALPIALGAFLDVRAVVHHLTA